jgi:hypothetical protein
MYPCILFAALELLENTHHPAWNISIDQQRLSQWPKHGDLTNPGLGLTLPLDDDDVVFDMEEGAHTDYVANADIPPKANNDLLDEGPAPLQFANEGPQETYGGLMRLNDSNGAVGAETGMCNEAVRRRVEQIRALDSGAARRTSLGEVEGPPGDWCGPENVLVHFKKMGAVKHPPQGK